jgi:hypothetical protein
MPISIPCPGCRAVCNLPDHLAGRRVRCARCRQEFDVPAAEGPVVLEAAEDDGAEIRTEPVRRPPRRYQTEEEGPPRRARLAHDEEDDLPRRRTRSRGAEAVPPRRQGGMPTGLIVGVAAGALVVLGCLGVGGGWFFLRSRSPATRPGPVAVGPDWPDKGKAPAADDRGKGALPPPVDRPAPPGPPPDPPVVVGPGDAGAGGVPGKVPGGDLAVVQAPARLGRVLPCLCWAADGRSFFAVSADGALVRAAPDTFQELRRADLKQKASWLAVSAEGLLLTLPDRQEVWVVDADSFEVKTRVPAPTPSRAVSAPGLSVAFVASGSGSFADRLTVLDLKKGEVVRQYKPQDVGGHVDFEKLTMTPDGKYLFTQGGIEQLQRFGVKGTEVRYEESTPRIAQNGQRIDVSPDGRYVCLPSGGGNYGSGQPGHPRVASYSTYVYEAGTLSRPAFTVESGAYPQAAGFDTKAGLVYAQNYDSSLIVFTANGIKLKEYKFGRGGRDVRQFLVHPDGGKLIVHAGEALYFVEVPKLK